MDQCTLCRHRRVCKHTNDMGIIMLEAKKHPFDVTIDCSEYEYDERRDDEDDDM